MTKRKKQNSAKLPVFFRQILWSYDLTSLDPEKNKKIIILQAINYGDLKHWRWLIARYGVKAIQQTLSQVPGFAIRRRVFKLASIIFSLVIILNNVGEPRKTFVGVIFPLAPSIVIGMLPTFTPPNLMSNFLQIFPNILFKQLFKHSTDRQTDKQVFSQADLSAGLETGFLKI